MSATATSVKRLNAQDSLWLCLAVIFHASLLLIPVLQQDHSTTSTGPLNITLLAPPPMEQPFVEEAEFKKIELPAVNKIAAPDEQPKTEISSLDEPENRAVQDPPGNELILTTARLLEAAYKIEWPEPDKDNSRQLGTFIPQALPENWRSGARNEDEIFNPMVLPGKTEVVDRWLASDGSHNVIVNTPDGHTLCGRALAWDPMQPLVENVMQFRVCGGNEKRTFEMTQRIKRLTSLPYLGKL